VPNDEIVMGYEYAKNQYAVIDPSEVEALRSEADRSINVQRFVKPSEIDPLYFSGRTYYLTPDGRAGEKPYALLHRAMTDEKVYGLAQVVISNREQLVALRPLGKLLTISVLHYADNLKPRDEFEDALGDNPVSAQELKLAKTLIEATREDDADLESFEDLYNNRLAALVEAKVSGHDVATPPREEAPPVINLIDALKASLKHSKGDKAAGARRAAPKKKMAASARTRRTTTKKRKSG
jgi:Ku protein